MPEALSRGHNERITPIMRFTRTATAVAGAVLLIGGLATTALASGSISPNIVDATQPTSNVTVSWSGITIPAGLSNIVVIQQCWKNDSGVFDQLNDCSQATGLNPPVGATGSGSQVFNVFNGDEQVNGAWGCGPLTTAATPKANTCYVRLAPGNATNTATDEFYPFTFGAPTNVPEVPMNILLPGSAAAVLGGAILIARRRHARMA